LIISLIAAIDDHSGIGKNNQLPWHLSSDLRRFKQLTMGHTIVMGRKTYETIGRALPGRITIILTHQENYKRTGCQVMNSLEEAIQSAEESNERELFVIGGGEVFLQAIDRADRIYLTDVKTDAHADVFFPRFNQAKWEVIEKEANSKSDMDEYDSTYTVYQREVENQS
jgi:dihydrofolate reductase